MDKVISPEERRARYEAMMAKRGERPRPPIRVNAQPPTPPDISDLGRKIILRNGQSPGDGVMLAYAVQSLKNAYAGAFKVDVRTPYNELFEAMYESKTLTHFAPKDGAEVIDMNYETIHRSNQSLYFYLDAMRNDLSIKLNLPIPPCEHSGFIKLRGEEKVWYSAVREELGYDVPYWVISAGYKSDYTAKQWSFAEYQKVVDMFPDTVFVQVGAEHRDHTHAKLSGDNVINLVGKTDLRQLIRLIYHSYGIISTCSMAMLLGYAVEVKPVFGRKSRANIAITGGREPNHWHQGPNCQYLHTCGMLDCCDFGGCWKSRVIPLGDGDDKDKDTCLHPVELPSGQVIARCMDMITADDVARHMRRYLKGTKFESGTGATPIVKENI